MDVLAERQHIEALFASLASNHIEEFLSGCSDQLLMTVRGSGALTSTVTADRLPLWWEGLHHLTDDTLETEVVLVVTEERSHVVVLRHLFSREGTHHRFDTVNFCTLRDGELAAWFSSPLDPAEYAEAWGLPRAEGRRDRSLARSLPTRPTVSVDLGRR